MANRWTNEQLAAIQTNGANLLVSAAAGSGKTAVLVERIIQKITHPENPIDIDRLLVVTFTNAAAAEMRERITAAITAKLEENPASASLARQLVLSAKANITTIHAFCLNLLRTHFNLAGTDPNFRIADSTENDLLRLEALEEAMDEMYEDEEFAEPFVTLLENYSSVKKRDSFDAMVLKIYAFVMSLPHPEQWLLKAAEKFCCPKGSFASSALAEMLLGIGKDKISEMADLYNDLIQKARLDSGGDNLALFLSAEQESLRHVLTINHYDEACRWASSVVFAKFPSAPKNSEPRYRAFIQSARKKTKETFLKNISGGIFQISSSDQEKSMQILYPQMRALSALVLRLIRRFDEKKEEKNLLNFNDLEHKCYRILTDADGQPTELARTVGNQFDEILIDEYQDTSRLQEAIFSAIKKPDNLFMVGDIKQSIYRFRNTDPLLFREKKEQFSTETNARNRKIILSKNFRSRPEILAGINDIFLRIMSLSAGEIDYNEEEMLYPGAQYPETPHPLFADLQLHVLDPQDSSFDETAESEEEKEEEIPAGYIEMEARLAAQEISRLISAKYQVYTKRGYRTITYRDICILLRTTKNWAQVFLQTLSQAGIPCYSETGGGFLQSSEVEVMLALLKVIDNPYQDLPLLAVLRSQIYAFSTNDLAKIRIADKKGSFYDALCAAKDEENDFGKRVRAFLKQLQAFREQAKYLPLSEFIWSLYQQTGFYEAQGTLQNGLLRQSNLRLFAMRAKEYESTSFRGLYSFVRFIDNYRSIGGDYDAARTIGEEQDVVRIMSIHKSKGLEFPVVMLCGAGKRMNQRDLAENILIHPALGYGPKFIDPDLRITYPTAVRAVVKEQMQQELLSEEMRVLYVALTRAREKLYVIGTCANCHRRLELLAAKTGNEYKIPAHSVKKASSYLDWFFMALMAHPGCEALRSGMEQEIPIHPSSSPWRAWIHPFSDQAADFTEQAKQERFPAAQDEFYSILRLLRFEYPFRQDETLPSKITVTELKNSRLRDEENDGVFLYPRPRFLQETRPALSGAVRGTAFHTVMQRLAFTELSEEGLQNQLHSLVENHYLTPQEAQSVDLKKIRQFFASEAGTFLLQADRVEREVLFGIQIPAKDAVPDYPGDAQIMLQGVIDCVIIKDGKLTILDYKTEQLSSAEAMKAKYRIQLDSYALAAETIFHLPAVRKWIYWFKTGQLIDLSGESID